MLKPFSIKPLSLRLLSQQLLSLLLPLYLWRTLPSARLMNKMRWHTNSFRLTSITLYLVLSLAVSLILSTKISAQNEAQESTELQQQNSSSTGINIKTKTAVSFGDMQHFANISDGLLSEIDQEALALMQTGKLLEARTRISQAIDATDFTGNVRLLINRLLIRASIDDQVGAYIGALQDLQFAFQLASSTNNLDLVADIAFFIAAIHQSRSEHSIALSYAKQALDTYLLHSQSEPIPVLLLSISSFLATKQIDKAFEFLNRVEPLLVGSNIGSGASELMYQSEQKRQKAQYFQYLGEAELYRDNIPESIQALNYALELSEPDAYQQLTTLNLLLSRAHTAKDDMDAAIDHLVSAFDMAKKTQVSFFLNQALQLHRASLLSQLNEFEAAYRVTQDVLKNRDFNQPIAEIKRMLDMHANFQLALQQQENAELKQDNQWKSEQIEIKQTLNKLYFVLIALLFCTCCLLLLLFIRGKKHRLSLEKIAHTDALTGLNSRTRVLEQLNYHQDLFNRNKQAYCLAIVDLDFFKTINDNYGHPTGDEVLKMFGELTLSSFRKTDILGRIGGEEFLFILPHTSIEQAMSVFTAFNSKLPIISDQLNLEQVVTASIGLVTPHYCESPMDIVKRADAALYEAKEQGRNCVVFGNKVATLQSAQTKVNL